MVENAFTLIYLLVTYLNSLDVYGIYLLVSL